MKPLSTLLAEGHRIDTGKLVVNGSEYKVIDTVKENEEIMHILDRQLDAHVGDVAHGVIDWDRRYAIMKYHTTLHLLDGVIEKNYKSCTITGGQIFVDRARMDLDFPGLNKDLILEIITETNKFAQEGHGISSREISREEALKTPNLLRTEPGRQMILGMSTVRLVEIAGLDFQMDGGAHVANTKEIGTIVFNAYENKGSHRKRIDVILQ